MQNFEGTKNLKNIFEALKSNVSIFREAFTYLSLTLNFYRIGISVLHPFFYLWNKK